MANPDLSWITSPEHAVDVIALALLQYTPEQRESVFKQVADLAPCDPALSVSIHDRVRVRITELERTVGEAGHA